ncbi:YHS domain-containing protein [Rhodobacteraceae bacterium NNCM2]|nr:YHS domain-containing protein [Coraliihabitans acroporae]
MIRMLLALMLFAVAVPVEAAELRKPEIYADFQGHALKGYDTVAYFTEGKPVKGSKAHSFEWKGATWLFSSAEHRDMFAANPEQYAPQFGGYCAYAITHDRTAPIDPTVFAIVDGKLYMNLNASVKEKWDAKQPQMIARGNEKWPGVLVLSN